MPHLGYLAGEHVWLPEGTDATTASRLWPRLRNTLRPKRIDSFRLVGARGAGTLRLVVANDVSGSMDEFAQARDTAIEHLIRWVGSNLRDTDEIGVLDFSDTAAWRMTPTSVAALREHGPRFITGTAVASGGTQLESVLMRARQLGDTTARTYVWLVSDGQYPDYPVDADAARRVLYDSGIDSMPLLVPSYAIEVPDDWHAIYPDYVVTAFDGHSPHQTALTFARTLALHTRQRLVAAPTR